MKTGLILFLFAVLSPAGLKAQEVINSAGHYSASPAGSQSWSLGEVTVFTISGGDVQLTQGFQQSIALLSVEVEAGDPATLCKTQYVVLEDLGASVLPPTFTATWSSSGSGAFNDTNAQTGVFGTATLYQLSQEDIANGGVTLVLTVDVNGAKDEVQVLFIQMNCGTFPWTGE